jgi:putative glutamine amidotransferase
MRPVIGITCGVDGNVLKVRQDYVSAVYNSGGIPVLLPIMDEASSLTDIFDGLLLTGGDDIPADYFGHGTAVSPEIAETMKPEKSERLDFEMALLRETLEKGKPVLAVCYGMQLMNAMHGGDLFRDIGCEVQKVLDHRKGMHDIEIIDPLKANQRKQYMVNSSHHQAVKDAGEGLEVFAVASDGIIEGIYKKDYNFCVGVQWHPERIFYDPLSSMLFEALTKKAAEAGRNRP